MNKPNNLNPIAKNIFVEHFLLLLGWGFTNTFYYFGKLILFAWRLKLLLAWSSFGLLSLWGFYSYLLADGVKLYLYFFLGKMPLRNWIQSRQNLGKMENKIAALYLCWFMLGTFTLISFISHSYWFKNNYNNRFSKFVYLLSQLKKENSGFVDTIINNSCIYFACCVIKDCMSLAPKRVEFFFFFNFISVLNNLQSTLHCHPWIFLCLF